MHRSPPLCFQTTRQLHVGCKTNLSPPFASLPFALSWPSPFCRRPRRRRRSHLRLPPPLRWNSGSLRMFVPGHRTPVKQLIQHCPCRHVGSRGANISHHQRSVAISSACLPHTFRARTVIPDGHSALDPGLPRSALITQHVGAWSGYTLPPELSVVTCFRAGSKRDDALFEVAASPSCLSRGSSTPAEPQVYRLVRRCDPDSSESG